MYRYITTILLYTGRSWITPKWAAWPIENAIESAKAFARRIVKYAWLCDYDCAERASKSATTTSNMIAPDVKN